MNESNPSDAALAELLTLTVSVNALGTTIYRNHLGQKHRVHGPSVIWEDGSKSWYQNDKCHRVDGPATIWATGEYEWWLNGEYLTEAQWNARIKSI